MYKSALSTFLGNFTFLSTFKSTFFQLFRTQNLYANGLVNQRILKVICLDPEGWSCRPGRSVGQVGRSFMVWFGLEGSKSRTRGQYRNPG